MSDYTLWYTKRGEKVLGPFPGKVLSQALLIGRIRMDDLVSVDNVEWRQVKDVPELIPDVMTGDMNDPEEKAKLEAARRNADDRLARDRRQREKSAGKDQRHDERRADESAADIEERAARAERHEKMLASERQSKLPLIMLLLLLTGFVAAAIWWAPLDEGRGESDCAAAPLSGVNWDNCQMPGLTLSRAALATSSIRNANLTAASLAGADMREADLSYSNLSLADLSAADLRDAVLLGVDMRQVHLPEADLRGADLSYADLRGAHMAGAKLAGAKLSKTIWWDGSVCGINSVGECIASAEHVPSLIVSPGGR